MRLASLFSVVAVTLVSASFTGAAFAADDEEGEKPKAKAAASTSAAAPAPAAHEQTTTDHELVNGHVGVGYMGQVTVPLGVGGTMPAQIVGIRYWTSTSLAITAGLGFGSTSSSSKAGGTTTDGPSATSFALKGGVALPLATGKHYAFVIEPQLVIGYATQTIKPASGTGGNTENSGTSIGVGATAGAEIQFGFMGIPELALIGSVGLAFETASGKTKTDAGEVSASKTSISTFTLANPWNIFAGNVAAIYYF
ncbi:MAG: hypothetical protein ACXWUG_12615 [Polyangiales bacterium]